MGHQHSCIRCRSPATIRYDIILPCSLNKALEFIELNPEYDEANHYLREIEDNVTRGSLLYCEAHDVEPKLKSVRSDHPNGIFNL